MNASRQSLLVGLPKPFADIVHRMEIGKRPEHILGGRLRCFGSDLLWVEAIGDVRLKKQKMIQRLLLQAREGVLNLVSSRKLLDP